MGAEKGWSGVRRGGGPYGGLLVCQAEGQPSRTRANSLMTAGSGGDYYPILQKTEKLSDLPKDTQGSRSRLGLKSRFPSLGSYYAG